MKSKNTLTITDYKILGTLPNPFVKKDGSLVASKSEWSSQREYLKEFAVTLQFGDVLPSPDFLDVELLSVGKSQINCKIHTGTSKKRFSFLMRILIPEHKKSPYIIDGDLCSGYVYEDGFISTALENGVGWVLFDRTELAHDNKDEGRKGPLFDAYPDYDFGTIMAWAWGYSRCVDALYKLNLPEVDLSCLSFIGHSRGGKAALLAGVLDERPFLVNPNEACLGGGGCYRVSCVGDYKNYSPWPSETLKDILTDTGYWFSDNMKSYVGRENALPFDAHYMKALVAPRILLVSEAVGDIWANPVGSWHTTMAAQEVFDYLEAGDHLYWYYREGLHHHSAYDVMMLVNIIRHYLYNDDLHDGFFEASFDKPCRIYDWENPNDSEETK